MVYFLGIGGIGVSALARLYLSRGETVVGSDSYDSEIIKRLKEEGAQINIGNKPENIPQGCDLFVYTPAAKADNPEMVEAKNRGLRMLSYPEALGELSKDYKTIAVAGTHGKSTTTSMIALMMVEAGFDPTVIVGTKLKQFGDSNFRAGKSDYLVIEACEYGGSFLNYYPKIAVITNIEGDHLDYYGNMENLRKAFVEFVSHVPQDGLLVQLKGLDLETVAESEEFSIDDKEAVEIKKIIGLPGDHNLMNGLATYKVGKYLGVPEPLILNSLSKYEGSWRRFDTFDLGDFILIDDYAHHPTEIRATLASAREKYPDKKICCVYQPHQYQRTQFLFDDFVSAFKDCLGGHVDKLLMLEVYDVVGREGNDELRKNYGAESLCKTIGSPICEYIGAGEDLSKKIEGYDVVIMMGAGNIYDLSQVLKEEKGYKECCTE
jgi:UDP-N-acetylmuramate--alanine ligase